MSKPEIILHHYQGSPYAEKVVAALRVKGLPWCSVATSPMLPRPLLEPLTNGYRRIPVMQIGNQIFCDTALILKELEKRYPSNNGGAAEGGAQASVVGVSDMIATWVDKQLFANIRDQMPWGASPEEQKANPLAAVFGSAAFLADRSQLSGGSKPINTEAIRRAQPLLVDQLASNLDTLEKTLQGPQEQLRQQQGVRGQGVGEGGWILNTLTPSMADCSVYGMVWWLMTTKRAPEFVTPLAFPCLFAWWGQMNAYMKKHRHPTQDQVKISGEDALQVARDAQKGGYVSTGDGEGVHEAERRRVGELVTVSPNDYGKVPVKGRIVVITKERVCIRPEHGPSQQGHVEKIEVLMHFPRNGYVIVPVGNVKAAL